MNAQPAAKRANLRDTWYGIEKQCSVCGEWWPADVEFFAVRGNCLHGFCRACRCERERKRRAKA